MPCPGGMLRPDGQPDRGAGVRRKPIRRSGVRLSWARSGPIAARTPGGGVAAGPTVLVLLMSTSDLGSNDPADGS